MKPLPQISSREIIDFLKTVDKKTWFKSGGIAAGVLLFLIFIGWPAWFERPSVRAQIKTLEGQILLTKSLFLKKPQLLKSKEEDSKWIGGSRSHLYEPGESSLLLGAIAQLATQSDVSVVASMPKDFIAQFPSPYNQEYAGNSYDFSVEGNYHNLGTFTGKIESGAKPLRIENFTLKSRAATGALPLAEINLSAIASKNKKATDLQ